MTLVWVGLGALGAFLVLRIIFAQPTRPRRAPADVLSDPEASSDARRIWKKMNRLGEPTLLLAPTDVPAFSKMGGAPELPVGAAWPRGPEGELGFLAQLDLAEIRASGGPPWLPATGSLYAFHDDRWGATDQVLILHAPEGAREAMATPNGVPQTLCYPERRVKFLNFISIPSLDWLEEDVVEIDVDDHELDALVSATDEAFGDELQHRVGGYPSEIQDEQMALASEYASRGLERDYRQATPPTIKKAAKAWRLLLQIDSDPALKMNWADAGRFYIFVREVDAQNGDFSKTVTISQTH